MDIYKKESESRKILLRKIYNRIDNTYKKQYVNLNFKKEINNIINKSYGDKTKELNNFYSNLKNVASKEINTLTKLKKEVRITNAKTSKQIDGLTSNTKSFILDNQKKAIKQALLLLPKQHSNIFQLGIRYKKKDLIAVDVQKNITKDELERLGTRVSKQLLKSGLSGSIGFATKYAEGWRGSYFTNFGDSVRIYSNLDSDQAFEDNEIVAYQIYFSEKPINRGGYDKYNDCFYNCLFQILGDTLSWKSPEELKKYLKLPRNGMVGISDMPAIEKHMKNFTINITGDYLYTSGIKSNKIINLKLVDEHYTVLNNKNSKKVTNVSFKERIPIIYDTSTFMAYTESKGLYLMSKDERNKHYNWETDYIIVNKEKQRIKKTKQNPNPTQLTLEEEYIKFIHDADTLKEITKGEVNLYKTGNNKTTALNLFDKFTKHIVNPPMMKQAESNEYKKTSTGALIFGDKYKGEGYKYDIKSAYPSIMKSQQLFPVNEGEFIKLTLDEFEEHKNTYFRYGIYKCHIEYNINNRKLFRFNDDNRYTHISLQRAKELNLNITLLGDDDFNFLHYSRDKLLTGNELFGRFIDCTFDLKQKKLPRAKAIINILWGSLCEKLNKKHIVNHNDLYDIPDNNELVSIKPYDNKNVIVKISNHDKQYKSGWARIAPFLLSKSRNIISKMIEPYKNICVRCHTDSMLLSEQPKDIKLGNNIGELVFEYHCKSLEVLNCNSVIEYD